MVFAKEVILRMVIKTSGCFDTLAELPTGCVSHTVKPCRAANVTEKHTSLLKEGLLDTLPHMPPFAGGYGLRPIVSHHKFSRSSLHGLWTVRHHLGIGARGFFVTG